MSKLIAQKNIKKALEEDASIFEYDEVYDDFKKKEKKRVKEAPKSLYINNLIKQAELRKREQEKRIEKKIQKERENEKGMFDDKETFVTSAYKQKLLEMQTLEEIEEHEKKIEDLLDVKKQNDLSGFYKHLLNQAVKEEKIPDSSKIVSSFSSFQRKNVNRNIRKRKESESSSDEDETLAQDNSPQKLISDEKSGDSNSKNKINLEKVEIKFQEKDEFKKTEKEVLEFKDFKKEPEVKTEVKTESTSSLPLLESKKMIEEPKKLDKNKIIAEKLKKRTIGTVFEAARERYLNRCRQNN